MNTLKMITGILFFLQCFTFTVLAESLPKFAMIITNNHKDIYKMKTSSK